MNGRVGEMGTNEEEKNILKKFTSEHKITNLSRHHQLVYIFHFSIRSHCEAAKS